MKLRPIIQDPITLKRLRRFRRRKRAYWSLWILVVLYAISLGSELICNDRPLLLRFKGKTYFPIFRYYPDDLFTGSGKQTRPDYKALRTSSAFQDDARSFMIFPPVSYGPYGSIDPKSLEPDERVEVSFTRIPHVGSINVDTNLTVISERAAAYFFGIEDGTAESLNLRDHYPIPAAMLAAIRQRFANQACDRYAADIASSQVSSLSAQLSLSRFRSRSEVPDTVRITLRESEGARDRQTITFKTDITPTGKRPPLWEQLADEQRDTLTAMAATAFEEPVYPAPISVANRKYNVAISRNDVSWPHAPTRSHLLGIDNAGRDVFARILYGLRISMTFGFLLVCAAMTIGTVIGAVQGYFGGKIDIFGQRLIEIWSAMPFLYIVILMGSIYGQTFMLLLFCYGLFNWIGISYYMRAEFLRLRNQPFVDAARCVGVRTPRIIMRHVLPNALTPVITFFPFSLVGAIGSLAALDYLGFGLPPPTPSWGELLHQAQQFRWAWWLILYPSLALFVVMLLGVFVGEGVRDAFDPRPFSKME